MIHDTRLLCYLFLAHTQYTYMTNVHDLGQLTPVEGSPSLCQLVEEDISFAFNVEYTQLTGDNCGDLSSNPVLYFIEDGAVVTDAPGLVIEKQLAWVDLMEATVWLFILFSIELIVRLQDRGITRALAGDQKGLSRTLQGVPWVEQPELSFLKQLPSLSSW